MDLQIYKFKIIGPLLSIIARTKSNDSIYYSIINVSICSEYINHTLPNKICILMKASSSASPQYFDIVWKESNEKTIRMIENIEGYKPSGNLDKLIGYNLYYFIFSILLQNYSKKLLTNTFIPIIHNTPIESS